MKKTQMIRKNLFRYFWLSRGIVTLFLLVTSVNAFPQKYDNTSMVLIKEGVIFYVQDSTIITNAKIIYSQNNPDKELQGEYGIVFIVGNTKTHGLNNFKNATFHRNEIVPSDIKISKSIFKEKKAKISYKSNFRKSVEYTFTCSELRFNLLAEKYIIVILSNTSCFKFYSLKEWIY